MEGSHPKEANKNQKQPPWAQCMVYSPVDLVDFHVGKYTVRPMDPMGSLQKSTNPCIRFDGMCFPGT